MAFGDSNDIKINVTVNTTDAKKAAKEIGDAFKAISKDIGADFKTIANISKDFANVRIAQIKAESAEEIQRSKERTEKKLAAIKADVEKFTQAETTKRETAKATSDAITQIVAKLAAIQKEAEATKREDARQTAKVEIEKLEQVADVAKEKQKTRATLIRAANALAIQGVKEETKQLKNASAENITIRKIEANDYMVGLKNNLAVFTQTQATIRSENKKTTEELRLEAAKVRQETVRLQKGLSDAAGSGKLFDALKSSFLGASVGIGPLTVGVGTLASTLGPQGLLIGAIGVATAGLAKFGTAAFNTLGQLAEGANRVQGLSTAFTTLQQSLARDPIQSIQRLREATQGLISDTDLYQKANQAVLLGVPAKLFDESAAAAVRLGRAMGIDARLALESLSIGLGRQSRLYLDNLGIIVSATEAYRKYAQQLKISANDLSDAQKRQAFFNETSVQIRDSNSKLPQILDDVGIAYQKLKTVTDNASDAFLRSFNNSSELEQALKQLKDELGKSLIPALETLGTVVARVFALIVSKTASAINAISQFTNKVLPDAIEGWRRFAEQIDIAFIKSSKTRSLQLATEISGLKKDLERLKEINELSSEQDRGPTLELAARKQEELNNLQKELNALLGAEASSRKEIANIPLRVENEQTLSDISETESAIAGLKKKVEEDLGIIRLPGIDINQVKQFEPELDAIFKSIESGALTGEAAGLAVEAAVKKISVALGEVQKKTTEIDIARIRKELEAAPDDSNLKLELAGLEQRLKLQTENVAVDEQQRLQLIKFVQERQKAAKKGAQEAKAAGKQSGDILKQRQNEIEKFLRSVAQKTNTAIPPRFEKKIADLFRNAIPGTVQFTKKLKELGEEFRDAGGDLDALAKSIDKTGEAFKRLAQQGVPPDLIPDSQELQESAADYNDYLASIQEGRLNLRDLLLGKEFDATGKKVGGGFFGFDLEGLAEDSEGILADQVQSTLSTAFEAGIDGFTRDDAPQLAASVGALVGTAFGAAIGGPAGAALGAQIGSTIGEGIGTLIAKTSTGPAEKIDDYFAELFNPGRIAFVVNRQIQDAAGNISTEPIVNAVNRPIDTNFFDVLRIQQGGGVFETLGPEIQAQYKAVGAALSSIVNGSFEDGLLIAKLLAEQAEDGLNNLQVLIQATGKSFQDFADSIYEAFLKSAISLKETYETLIRLGNYFEKGIPGAVGAYEQAISNAVETMAVGGRAFIDSVRDIGAEGEESKKSFDEVVRAWAEALGLKGEEIELFFAALRSNGINTLRDLGNAGLEQIIRLGRQTELIKDKIATTPAELEIPKIPAPTDPNKPSGTRRKSPAQIAAEERAELLKRQTEEARSLTAASKEYQAIVEKIAKGILTQEAGGRQLLKLQQEILAKVKQRDDLEKKINGELDKGAGANAKLIAEYEKKLKKIEDRLAQINEEVETSTNKFKDLNIKGILPLIKDSNNLGVVSRIIGVDLQTNIDILIEGFRRGKLSIAQVNAEIAKTQDLLGEGIPEASGAVDQAFKNLIDAGEKGGEFSLDAFGDIFAEYREKFAKEGSALREQQRKQLLANFDATKEALLQASGPEQIAAAQKAFDDAETAYNNFIKNVPKPDLAGLREELLRTFAPEEVDKFFRALDESGMSSFEDFEKAGDQSVIAILGRLKELGFQFNQTTADIQGINNGLNQAAEEANGGKDPLDEALRLVRDLNNATGRLPAAFNQTGEAAGKLNGPLKRIADSIEKTLTQLGKLSGNKFNNDVIFNVKTTGDSSAQALVELLFGPGDLVSDGTGNGSKGKKRTVTKTLPKNEKPKR